MMRKYILVRQAKLFIASIKHLVLQSGAEERRHGEDVFMGGEKPVVTTHDNSHDGTGEGTAMVSVSMLEPENT